MKPQIISQSQRQQIQQAYERALIAMGGQAQNRLLAHRLLSECVIHDPATPIYINALLENLQSLPNRPTATWISKFRNWKFFQAAKRQRMPDAIGFGLQALYRHPTDLSVLCRLAEVCQAVDLWAAAECYLRQALLHYPNDQRPTQLLAESLLQQARFEESLYHWQKLPADKQLDAQIQDVIQCLQSNLPATKTTSEANPPNPWEEEIAENPTSPKLYLEITQRLVQEKHWDEATSLLTRGLSATGSNPELLDLMETVRLDSYRHRHEIGVTLHQINPQILGIETLHDLQSELDRTELQVCERRARRYPTDYRHQLQLAICLRQARNYRGALKQLEQIPEMDQTAAEVALETGKCHQHLHQFSKAAAAYRHLIDGLENQAERCIYEQALYHGGILTGAMGDGQLARQWLSRLLELSPDYQDARDRLDKIKVISDNKGTDNSTTSSPESGS